MKNLISIIVPVYNVESFLDRCIQSILNQTYKNLEVLLINDGSIDSSGFICDKYALIDNRVSVHHIANGGSSIARNFGLKICTGDFIGFVDSDDWIKPNMFHELLDYSLKNNLKVVEINSTEAHLEDNISSNESPFNYKIEDRNTALKRIINKTKFAVWRRIYHKSIVKNRFFIEGILHQDVYFTIDILNEISHIGYIDKPMYIYNIENPTSVIRSDYSSIKLQSINAGEYVLEKTRHYNKDIQSSAKQYHSNFLRYHYNSLFSHQYLDDDYQIRKEIRRNIRSSFSFNNFNFYNFIILTFPLSLYKIFLFANNKRIIIQNRIQQLWRNV